MSDNETLAIKYFCVALAVIIATMGGCIVHRDVLKYEAVKSGVDPMAISCASGIRDNEQHVCTLIAQREARK